MLSYIKSENLKFKRTFSRKFIFLAPLIMSCFAYLISFSMPDSKKLYNAMAYNWWALIFISFGPTLLCIFSILKDNKTYEFLISRGISKEKFWFCKIIILSYYLFIANLFMFIFTNIINYLLFGSYHNILAQLSASAILFLVSICLVPINLIVQYKTSTIITVIFNFIGLILGIKLSVTSFWGFAPWGYALRLLCPVMGVQPNGLFLEESSFLWDGNVILPGIILCLSLFVIFTCIIISLSKLKN